MSFIRKEFTLRKFSLNTEDLSLFTTSQWCKSRYVFLVYRLLLVLYWIIGPVLAASVPKNRRIYANHEMIGNAVHDHTWTNLTGWALVVLEVDFGLAALICLVALCVGRCRRLNDGNLPWFCRLSCSLSWLVNNINSSIGVLVTIVYFGILYDKSGRTSALDLHIHGLTTVFIVVDNVVSARPRRLLHFVYPLGFGLVYFIFSAIFWSFDNDDNVNYRVILDWNVPGRTFGCCVGLGLLVVVIHAAHFFLYKLKLFVHSKVCGKEDGSLGGAYQTDPESVEFSSIPE